MIKFNNPEGKEVKQAKIGQNRGEKLPPGKYVLQFERSKSNTSENKAAGTAGNLQVIAEWTVVRILSGGEEFKNWDGNTLTAYVGVRRSNTFDLTKNEQAQGQLNEMCLFLHGINAKNPAELRENNVVSITTREMTRDQVEAEIRRSNNELDKFCNNVVDNTDNALLGVRVECEVKDVVTTKGNTTRTFLAHNFSLCTQAEDIAHNKELLG